MSSSNSTSFGLEYFAVKSSVSADVFEQADFLSGVLKYQYELVRTEMRRLNGNPSRELPPVAQISAEAAFGLVQFVESLEPIACLEDGWNGPGTVGPSVVGIWQAVMDTYRLLAISFPVPSPKILSDGRLGVYWKGLQCYATIDFEEDGVHIWTVANGKRQNTGTWNSCDKVPEALRFAGPAQNAEVGRRQMSINGARLSEA